MDVDGNLTGRCARHPERDAIGICGRCGSYYCGDCYKVIDHTLLCSGCLAIPGVDYVSTLRERYWGKRDAWIWFFGALQTLSLLLGAAASAFRHEFWQLPSQLLSVPISVSYFLMLPAARRWLFGLVPLGLLGGLLQSLNQTQHDPQQTAVTAGILASAPIGILLMTAAYRDTRNKLAFRVAVSDDELAKLHKRISNATADRSLIYGVLSLIVPFLGLLSLGLGVVALRRVNPRAWPPIGGRAAAIVGVALSCVSLVLWTTLATRLIAP